MSRQTEVSITIGKTKLTDFERLTLKQSTKDHHLLELQVSQHWLAASGKTLYHQVKDLIGETLFLQIKARDLRGKQLEYRGVISGIATGKGQQGMEGSLTIHAFSPTALMDDHPHTESYEEKSIKQIARRLLSNYPQNLLHPKLQPTHTDAIPYTVQYSENSWNFLRRLAGRWGQWFFYDGMELILGRYESEPVTLTHGHNLESFDLGMKLRPTGQTLHGYEYRSDQNVTSEASTQSAGSLNEINAHILKKSDSLYPRKALRRVNQPLSSAANREVREMAKLQRKSDIAGMVQLSGQSTEPTLCPGSLAKINETLSGKVEYGRYFITEITHHCNAAGDYHNQFTALPEQSAHPPVDLDRTAYAEPQSATVMDNHDPEGLGRIRVQFRWQQGGMSPWLRILSAAGGGDKGFYMIPEKGEEVMVDFEGGNPERPYVLGATYNGSAKTRYGNENNDVKAIKTRSGNEMAFDDKAGDILLNSAVGEVKMNIKGDGTAGLEAPERIDLEAKEINLNADSINIRGGNRIRISSRPGLNDAGPGTIMIEAKQDMSIATKDKGVLLRSKSLGINTEKGINLQDGKAIIYKAPKINVE